MSRRASFFARTHPGQRRVRFPDEILFHESVKESDGEAVIRMLRRVSVDIDINRINMSGMTALHQVRFSFVTPVSRPSEEYKRTADVMTPDTCWDHHLF